MVNVWYRQNAMKIVLLVLTMMATTHLRKMYKPYRNRFSDKFKHVQDVQNLGTSPNFRLSND